MASTASLSMPQLQREPTNLFNLPLELQLQIYEYALSDPNLWDRRHRYECDLCPLTQGVVSQPPFMWHRVVVDAVPERGGQERIPMTNRHALPGSFSLARTWTACDCGKRRGINLLRVNRHIFHVAAHMLWSRGSLCFFDAAEFAACVGITSPGTRALIRGVSIMSLMHGAALDSHVCLRSQDNDGLECPSARYPWSTRCLPVFWRALLLLPRLHRLAIPYGYLDGNVFRNMAGDQLFKTRTYLSRLGYVDLTHVNVSPGDWNYRAAHLSDDKYFWADFFGGASLTSLYGFSERIDTTTWLDDNKDNQPRDTVYNKIYMRRSYEFVHAVFRCMQIQVMEWDTTTIKGTFWWRPRDDVIASDGTCTVRYGIWGTRFDILGTRLVAVTFYNAPLSRDACEKSNLALTRRRAELERLGRSLEAVQRKRKLARERMILRFEALCRGEKDAFEGVGGKLGFPGPIVGKPPSKRVRFKKNRRGYRKSDAWQE